jgi:hypothetical protein
MTAELTTLPSDRAAMQVTQATAVEQHRAAMEVQAAVVVAQNVPRDMARAEAEMLDACRRSTMAERAFYSVPKRGRGPSVHLARELARIWGNLQYGVHELRRDDDAGMSEVQAFAWDVQTNARSTRTFQVPHQRMRDGKRVPLVDLGDVYLNNQNIGARAVRECIFSVLPMWFTEAAQNACNETIRNGEGKPLAERIKQMVDTFGKAGVKVGALEQRIGKKRGQWDAGDVATFSVIFTSLQRGETTVGEEFPDAGADESLAGKSVADLAPAADEKLPDPHDGTDTWAAEAKGADA